MNSGKHLQGLSNWGKTEFHRHGYWALDNCGYDNRANDLQQLSEVAQIRVLHGLVSQPIIMTSMIYQITECREEFLRQRMELGDVVPSDCEDER